MVAQTATAKARTVANTGFHAVKVVALAIGVLLGMFVLMTAPIGIVWPFMAIEAFTAGNTLAGILASGMTTLWLGVCYSMVGGHGH